MPGKKKSSKSAKSRKSSGASKKSKKSAKSSAKSSGGSTLDFEARDPDIMDPPAMNNLYYIAHGPVDALEIRGFGWAEAPKGKKGKKKKK